MPHRPLAFPSPAGPVLFCFVLIWSSHAGLSVSAFLHTLAFFWHFTRIMRRKTCHVNLLVRCCYFWKVKDLFFVFNLFAHPKDGAALFVKVFWHSIHVYLNALLYIDLCIECIRGRGERRRAALGSLWTLFSNKIMKPSGGKMMVASLKN